MTVNPEQFRQTLSRFASGVTVVSARLDTGAQIGVTVSAFSSVSLSPPLILICLDNSTSNLDVYLKGPAFAVNILASEQGAVSNAFAFQSDVPPFEKFPFRDGLLGVPLLDDTVAALECVPDAIYQGGDHQILVGRVAHVRWSDSKSPLLYAAGRYGALSDPIGAE